MIRLPQSWFSWWLSRDSLIWLKLAMGNRESCLPPGVQTGRGWCDSEDVEVSHNLATSLTLLLLIWCGHSRDRDSLGQYVREVRRMTMTTTMMMMIRIMVMTVMSVTRASSLDCGRRPGWFTCNSTDTGAHTTCLAPAQVCDGHKVKQKPYLVF